jgi:hypothetical protein
MMLERGNRMETYCVEVCEAVCCFKDLCIGIKSQHDEAIAIGTRSETRGTIV